MLVSVTALLLKFRLLNSLERRIELIESGLQTFFRDLADHDTRLSRLEEIIVITLSEMKIAATARDRC